MTLASLFLSALALVGVFGRCFVLAAALIVQRAARTGTEPAAGFRLYIGGWDGTSVQSVYFARRTDQEPHWTASFAATPTSNGV